MNAIVCDTPESIYHYRLCALKGALKLEAKGLRHSKLGSVRKIVCKELGLKPSTKAPKVLESLEAKIKEIENPFYNAPLLSPQ